MRPHRLCSIILATGEAAGISASTSAGAARSGAARAPARCHTAQLAAGIHLVQPGAGERDAVVTLRNRGRRTCSVYGYAGMELVGRRGRPLLTRVVRVHARRPHRVLLAPGARASALLYWASAARTGDRQRGPCQPRPARVEVTPPDETTQLLLRWPDGPVCGQGRISLLPFRAGTRGF